MARYEFGIGKFSGATFEEVWRTSMTLSEARKWIEELYESQPNSENRTFRVIRRPMNSWEEVH